MASEYILRLARYVIVDRFSDISTWSAWRFVSFSLAFTIPNMQVPTLPLVSWDTYAAISLVIATPWLYVTYKPFSTTPSNKARSSQAASTLLLLHTLYMLHGLFVSSQENIFKALGVTLNVPTDQLRSKLAEIYGGEQNFPEHLQLLLRRLALVEMRSLYVRYVLKGMDFSSSAEC